MNGNASTVLKEWQWPDQPPTCPRCGHYRKIYRITTRSRFKCASCHHQFSATSGTVHHARKADPLTIEKVTNLLAENPSITVAEIMRQTGMSYRGAYYLTKRMRAR